jgi:hypothetical protein
MMAAESVPTFVGHFDVKAFLAQRALQQVARRRVVIYDEHGRPGQPRR